MGKQEWISVKGGTPKEDKFYLVSTLSPFNNHRSLGLKNFTDGSGYYTGEVTHYMEVEQPSDKNDK